MFFEPIIKWAVEILENVEQCALKPSDVTDILSLL